MANITRIWATQILDSRGNPTIEAQVELSNGVKSRSSVPSGASTGSHEALELRDSNSSTGTVFKAINNVNDVISQALIGVADNLSEVDKTLLKIDGSDNKSRLGSNALLSVSQACAKAFAASYNMPLYEYLRRHTSISGSPYKLPTPMFNMLEGGKHSSNGLNFQEYLVIPGSSKRFHEQLEIGRFVFNSVKALLKERSMSLESADEAGFAPSFLNNKEALSFLKNAVDKASFAFALDVFLGVDVASNSFYNNKKYSLLDKSTPYSQIELCAFYEELFNEFSLLFIEDPFSEDDKEGWKCAADKLLSKTLVVGDDLTTTNPYRFQTALDENLINGIIIKPNQIGTVTETLIVTEMARAKNIKIVVSHRSGETMDDFIADFAVGVGADYVKFGAPARERVVKYNRLLGIQRELKV